MENRPKKEENNKISEDSSYDDSRLSNRLITWVVLGTDLLLMYDTTLMTTAHSEFTARISFLDYIYRAFLIPRVDRQLQSTGRLDAFDLPTIGEGASLLGRSLFVPTGRCHSLGSRCGFPYLVCEMRGAFCFLLAGVYGRREKRV